MTETFKKTILFDLDGVLNTYEGKYDKNYIQPIQVGAYILIKELSENYKIINFYYKKFFNHLEMDY